MVYDLLRALLGESGFLATIAGGSSRRLDISVEISGPHDFAVRVSHRSSKVHPRPPHPAATFVTMANAPLETV